MKTEPIRAGDLCGVFAVPPLARRTDRDRSLDIAANARIVRHLHTGGITRILYGGNAFLYHIRLSEYGQLLEWLASLEGDLWAIPSAGPSYGRAMDQAPLLRRYPFPAVMMLPCADPRTPIGLEQGLREFADAAEKRLILYLKEEGNFGVPKEAGLDAVARLVEDGICVAIKYAVVRHECAGAPPPTDDPYLDALLARVDRSLVVSGIGERPAVAHMRHFGLPGFTTGSGCIAPALSQALFHACQARDWERAERIRERFLPLEDCRDRLGPSAVLHEAVAAAGIAPTGPIPPFASGPAPGEIEALSPIVRALRAEETP
jgi:dihydrodipicolinate synthase/N-acetylneuraminate lyase